MSWQALNPWRDLAGLPRSLWVLSFATLVNRAGTMVLPFLTLHLTRNLGLGPARAGQAVALYGFTSLVTSPLVGRLGDRWGALRVARASLAGSALLLVALPLARDFASTVALLVPLASLSEAVRPTTLALVGSLAPLERHRSAFALHRLAVNLGTSVGPAVGGLLADVAFGTIFVIDGLTSLLAALALGFVRPDEGRETGGAGGRAGSEAGGGAGSEAASEAGGGAGSEAASEAGGGAGGGAGSEAGSEAGGGASSEATEGGAGAGRGGARAGAAAGPAFRDRHLILLLVAIIPITLVFFQNESTMALYVVRELALPTSFYGALFTLNTLIIVLGEVRLNALMANWPAPRALAFGVLVSTLGIAAMALAQGPLAIAATVVIWTVGEMIFFPTSSAYVAELAPPDRRGEYMGYYGMTFGLGLTLGPWLGTLVFERWGGRVLWALCLPVGLTSVLLFAALGRAPRSAPGSRA